eukprot:5303308-Prymnesium_polylepis.2
MSSLQQEKGEGWRGAAGAERVGAEGWGLWGQRAHLAACGWPLKHATRRGDAQSSSVRASMGAPACHISGSKGCGERPREV